MKFEEETRLRREIEIDMNNTIINAPVKDKPRLIKASDKWIKSGRPVNQKTIQKFKEGLLND